MFKLPVIYISGGNINYKIFIAVDAIVGFIIFSVNLFIYSYYGYIYLTLSIILFLNLLTHNFNISTS